MFHPTKRMKIVLHTLLMVVVATVMASQLSWADPVYDCMFGLALGLATRMIYEMWRWDW